MQDQILRQPLTTPAEILRAADVILRGYAHPLPSSLQSIGGSLDVRGYAHPLPSSLQSIGGSLYVEGYAHPLPKDLKVGGGIIR